MPYRSFTHWVIILAVICIVSLHVGCAATGRRGDELILVRPFAEKPLVDFVVRPSDSLKKTLTELGEEIPKPADFQPTIPNTYGLGLNYHGIGLAMGKASTLSKEELQAKGKTDFSDYQIHWVKGFLGVDLYYQKYTGFYLANANSAEESSATVAKSEVAPQFPATTFERRAMNVMYINNHQSFSLPAAFEQSTYTGSSGFSWLTMTSMERIEIKEVPYILTDVSDPDSGYHFAEFDTLAVQTGPGFTIHTGLPFISMATLFGIAYQQQIIQQYETDDPQKTNAPTLKAHLRAACGLDPGNYFIVGTYFLDYTEIPTEDYDVRFLSGMASIAVGGRF